MVSDFGRDLYHPCGLSQIVQLLKKEKLTANGAKKRKAVAPYDDFQRTVRVVKDRAAFGDLALAMVSHFNLLGELFVERQTDDMGWAKGLPKTRPS